MSRFSDLPEPIALEDTITSEDVLRPDPAVSQIEDDWLLRNAGG